MDSSKVDMFIMTNARFFEGHQIPMIREKLLKLDDSKFVLLRTLNLKDPTTILIVSLLAGPFAIDRFMLGDTGLAVAKLLTCGGFMIWTIVDYFIVMGRAREVNLEIINNSVALNS
ncbi:MAG TPA: TM2 domain-containing protein [Cyclobacteriaceae bacterium]|nr:TM2 domain-containing protein [Cyclobacteriaceae bacterium]